MRSKLNGWNDSRFGPAFKGPPDSRAHLRDWLSKTSTILCLAIMAIFLMAWPACADSSGLKNPETGSNVAETPYIEWTNPNNIKNIDSANATATLRNQYSVFLRGTDYGFNIPANATIEGIEVTVNRSGSAQDRIRDHSVRLVKNGETDMSDNKADTANFWPTRKAAKTYGGSTDLWNTAWTPEDINKSNFGAQVRAYNPTNTSAEARVDCIQITVYYTTDYITDTDWIDASRYQNNYNNGVVNPNYAYTSDDNRAIFDSTNDRVDYTFGTDIVPANAVIRGVEVRLEARRNANNATRTLKATLCDGNTLRGSAKNLGTLTNSDVPYILGGPSDVWGWNGWTAAKINSNLSVRVQGVNNSGQAQLDCISIRVTYAIPDTTPPVIAPPRSTPSTSTPRPSWTMTVRNWASRA